MELEGAYQQLETMGLEMASSALDAQLIQGATVPTEVPDYGRVLQDDVKMSLSQTSQVTEIVQKGRHFLNKKIMILGDSISALPSGGRAWQDYCYSIIVPQTAINLAVGGATWADKAGTIYDGNPVINGPDNNVNNTIGNQVQKVLNNNYPEPDILIILAGTNDILPTLNDESIEAEFWTGTANKPLDQANRMNLAGAIRYSVETLRNFYPNAQIFITTPLQRSNTTVNQYPTTLAKVEVIKKIALRMSVPVINQTECGVYGMTGVVDVATGDYNDGLHLSIQGAKKVGRYIARYLIKWFSF